MDLFFHLSKDVRTNLFRFDKERTAQLIHMITDIKSEGQHSTNKMSRLSAFGLDTLPIEEIPILQIKNPYSRWKRLSKQKAFEYGNWRRRIPNGKFRKDLRPNVAYAVDGFEANGSYASVKTFVVFNGQKSAIKVIDESDSDWFELVSHAYMCQIAQNFSNITVPKLLFMQRSPKVDHYNDRRGIRRAYHYMTTQVCMERAEGTPFVKLDNFYMLTALAHAMRAIYQLQKATHFIHRDLSGHNIMYEPSNHQITFIDFGMTCINPHLAPLSWQKKDEDFYLSEPGSHGAMCTNRSLDPSVLIAFLSKSHPWCAAEHLEMKRQYKKAIESSDNERAKQALYAPRKGTQYTTIRPGDWSVGNELRPWDAEAKEGDGWHWWLFNMIEFPVEYYFPENILCRLLRLIPLDQWFAIRKGWSSDFDKFMPKDVHVELDDGRTGVIQKLVRRKLNVLVGSEVVHVHPYECKKKPYLNRPDN